MGNRLQAYKRFIFIGIITISTGIIFSTTLSDSFGSLGTVIIAIGGLCFIIGMHKKREEDEGKNK